MNPICLIPARAGSKGLPNKNLLFLDGKPMIFHTIDAAIESGLFDKEDIYVSTDSLLYKEICEKRGIKVVIRPDELSTDFSTSYDFTEHFLQDFEDNQVFVLLQVTSPLRNGQNIKEAMDIYNLGEAENVVSFSKIEKSPKFFTELDENGYAKDICGVDKGYRRQNDKKELYAPNGAIYITTKGAYLSNKSYFTPKTKAYIMKKEDSIDVDDRLDFTSVIGRIYFDYKLREKNSKLKHSEEYKSMIFKCDSENIIIGDSSTLNTEIENYFNFSIGRVTTSTCLENIDTIFSEKYNNVILSLGINDLIVGYDIDTIKRNYKELVLKLKDYVESLYLVEISYTLFRDSVNNNDITNLNNFIQELSIEFNLPFIEVNNKLSYKGSLNYDYTTDGLHLNEEGQLIYNDILKENSK